MPHLHDRPGQVRLPLDPGTRVDCRWRDGQMYPARVIERRAARNGIDHEYYMHYIKCAPALPPSATAQAARTADRSLRLSAAARHQLRPHTLAQLHHASCQARGMAASHSVHAGQRRPQLGSGRKLGAGCLGC